MPIYDYHCAQCNKDFELLVSHSAVPACPTCGSPELEKRLSLPAPKGKTADLIARGRAQAAKEGHFSNYSAAERSRLKT